jgi:hypothetical protein
VSAGALITGFRSDECRNVQAAKIRRYWEEIRTGCVEILGVEFRRGGVETENAWDAAMRKTFSTGSTIAEQGCEQLVHFVVKYKSIAETIGQGPNCKEALL